MRVPTRRYDKTYERPDPHITEAKYEQLKAKLDKLNNVSRFKAMEEVRVNAENGDFSENAAYQIAKSRLRGINWKIWEIQEQLKQAIIIKSNIKRETVELGATVRVEVNGKEKTYQLLGSTEVDPVAGIISSHSPLGAAIMGKKIGDIVKVDLANKKQIIVKILNIK